MKKKYIYSIYELDGGIKIEIQFVQGIVVCSLVDIALCL